MGQLFKLFQNLHQKGANSREKLQFLYKFDPKFGQFGTWMGPFFLQMDTCMGGTSKFPAAHPLEISLICILLSASRDVHFDKRMICFLSGLF